MASSLQNDRAPSLLKRGRVVSCARPDAVPTAYSGVQESGRSFGPRSEHPYLEPTIR